MQEESKETNKAGYNKKHWWEGGPITYETLEEKAEHWTLGADAATATLLQQISSKMIARTHEVEAALKNVCEDVDDLHVSLSNVATSLHLLSNMQFTENRTYQEDESSKLDLASSNIKTEKSLDTTQEDLMSSCCQAIAEGLELVKNSYMKMEISDSESEGGEEEQRKKGILTVYKHINPYENRKLPHLIGSSNFYTDDTLGLVDVEEDEGQMNDEKWSTTSSVCSGDGRDRRYDDQLLPSSIPIVANSSKMEDEDSDSDESFILSSKEINKRGVEGLEQQHRSTDQVSTSSDISNKKKNATPSTLLQPNSNGVLLNSDEEYGSIFEPPRDSYITRPSPRRHIDSEPLFKSDLKNPELSHENSEKERLFRGIQELPRERSKLFDLSDSDEEGLFSSRKERKSSGTAKPNSVKSQNVQTPEGGLEGRVNEKAQEDSIEQGSKDDKTQQTSESNLPGRHKKPVGGINIFNAAITKAIESQHISGSNKEHSAQNSGSQNISNEKTSKRESLSNEKDEERGLFLPKSIASSHNNNTSSKVNVSSNNQKKKSSTSLFFEDDDDDLFRPSISKSAQSTVISRSPVLSKSKSLDSNTSVSAKSKMDHRATTLDSIFGDSDDDLFTSVKRTQSNRNTSVVASSYQTEPPPLPQSSYSSSLSNKVDSIAQNTKSKVSIFSSSSSDDEIFTPRKSREKPLGVNKPGSESSANSLRQEPLNPPQSVDVTNSYLRSADLVTNSEHSNNPILDKSSNTYSDSSSKLSTKGKKLISQNHPATIPKKTQIKSLFGSSDEDDNDIFTPKSKKIGEKKVLTSSRSDESSSSNVLKPDKPKKVINDTTDRKTVVDGNKELLFENDPNPNTLSNNRNIESDSSEDDIFKSSSKKISKPKDTLSKFDKTAQLETGATQFGSTVSDPSVSPGQGTSSQNDILNTQNKSTVSNANDIFNDSSVTDIFSDLKSKSTTVLDKNSDKPITHIDSSDDDLFSNKKPTAKSGAESNYVKKISENPSSDNLSSNKVKNEENLAKNTLSKELTKTKDFDNNNIYGINNNSTNNSIQKKNKPGKNIFSSDSDEDIFSTIKTNVHKKGTKSLNIFSDSDDNDDIFSANFESKHKLGDNTEKNFDSQTPKLVKSEVAKPAYSKCEIRDSNKKPIKMPKPVVAEPIVNEKEKSSTVREKVTKSDFIQQSKINLPAGNSTETAHKNSLTKSILDDGDDDDLFTSSKSSKSAAVTEQKSLKSSMDKRKEVERDSTDGITSSKPKQTLPKLGKENNNKEVKSKHVNEKNPSGERPFFQERSEAGGTSLFKGDSPSQSSSPTKNMVGGLPFFKNDGQSLSSPTKKPVGGVALFGGEELLSRLKSRRKSSSSESEKDDNTEVTSTEIKSSNLQSVDSSPTSAEVKANKIYSNQIPSPTVTQVAKVSGSISNQYLTPSISQEASVSFDSEERASDLLVSVNKDRPKIPHQRKPPSRLRKNRKETPKNSDLTDSVVDIFESNTNKDEIIHKKVPDSSSFSKNQSFLNSGNEGEVSTLIYDKSPPQRNKRITLEKHDKPIYEDNKSLDRKSKPVPGQEDSSHKFQNMENSCGISENKKSFTEDEVLSSKNQDSSSSVDPSRKLEPSSLGLEAHGTKVVSSEFLAETTKVKTNIDYSKEPNLDEKNLNVGKVLTSQEKHSRKSPLKIFDDDNEDDDNIFSSTKPQSDILPKNVDTNLKINKVSDVEKHLKVDDIFDDGESEEEISVSKLSMPSTSIFEEDDDDIDSLFNASSNKILNKSTESIKPEPKLTKEYSENRKTPKPNSSIFSDDDDDDDSLFSSTAPSSKKVFAPPKVKTGKGTAKQLSIFNDDDDDDSESDLFGGRASSESASKQPPPKTDPHHHSKGNEKETQESLPSKSPLSKERTFVDPLMGNL